MIIRKSFTILMNMHSIASFPVRRIFCRSRSLTVSQRALFVTLWQRYGLDFGAGFIDDAHVFGRVAPYFLEIGFGSGESLLAAAKANPDKNFIGIDVYEPGIFSLLVAIEKEACSNIRVAWGDVMLFLTKCIPPHRLAGVQIFFPDPWPKRRHHKRRLIQMDFLQLLVKKLVLHGTLHLATDWPHYAEQIDRVLSQCTSFSNVFANQSYAPVRSLYRPIMSKFEKRSIQEKRHVFEWQYFCEK